MGLVDIVEDKFWDIVMVVTIVLCFASLIKMK